MHACAYVIRHFSFSPLSPHMHAYTHWAMQKLARKENLNMQNLSPFQKWGGRATYQNYDQPYINQVLIYFLMGCLLLHDVLIYPQRGLLFP
jgi:hypothetical protein